MAIAKFLGQKLPFSESSPSFRGWPCPLFSYFALISLQVNFFVVQSPSVISFAQCRCRASPPQLSARASSARRLSINATGCRAGDLLARKPLRERSFCQLSLPRKFAERGFGSPDQVATENIATPGDNMLSPRAQVAQNSFPCVRWKSAIAVWVFT